MEDSDNYGEFTEADRAELIFHIFKLLCRGGPLNQVSGTHVSFFVLHHQVAW